MVGFKRMLQFPLISLSISQQTEEPCVLTLNVFFILVKLFLNLYPIQNYNR